MEQKKKKEKAVKMKEFIRSQIVDDVFSDPFEMAKLQFVVDYDAYLKLLGEANPEIYQQLKNADTLEQARDSMYNYLDRVERDIFTLENDLHFLEKATVRECIRVFKSIIGPVNEHRTSFSALETLWKLAHNKREELSYDISAGFLLEFINLFRGIAGKSNIYYESHEVHKSFPEFLKLEGREAAIKRSEILDQMGNTMQKYFKKYPSGLDKDVINWRRVNRKRILSYFKATEEDWGDYHWQLKNVIRDAQPIYDLIELTEEQRQAIDKAVKNRIPFGITPFYLSLMDRNPSVGYDHAVRAQVIPPPDYVEMMLDHKTNRGMMFDFMGEYDTSPIELITRRYPNIAILKPFNTCAQICVYCQRNWEIDQVLHPRALAGEKVLDEALKWFDKHTSIEDVLVTGGDPIVMNNKMIHRILEKLASKKHIQRIRIGTRTPVVLPMRWTDELVGIVAEFHEPGKREIAVITHFEHSYEITLEAMLAVQKIRKAGLGVYNQQVFTIENARKFETAKLRRDLRLIGIDPYYTFNMKGKDETRRYMVPIARILQERKEEARLLPGLDRTDEPVFNVPKLGKNHLRAWQDHRLVMIMPDGSRIYAFHPWEKNITPMPPYYYKDVPIFDFLEELAARGENIRDYRTIWYYF